MSNTFCNPESGETLRHTERADGTRQLFVWQGDSTARHQDHQHHIFNLDGSVRLSRDFNGRTICDDRL